MNFNFFRVLYKINLTIRANSDHSADNFGRFHILDCHHVAFDLFFNDETTAAASIDHFGKQRHPANFFESGCLRVPKNSDLTSSDAADSSAHAFKRNTDLFAIEQTAANQFSFRFEFFCFYISRNFNASRTAYGTGFQFTSANHPAGNADNIFCKNIVFHPKRTACGNIFCVQFFFQMSRTGASEISVTKYFAFYLC